MEASAVNPALSWTVWVLLMVGITIFCFVGTWLIARRLEE